MKQLAVSAAALAAVYIGSVYLIGGVAEARFTEEFSAQKQMMEDSGQAQVSELVYERSFFGAQANFSGELFIDADNTLKFTVANQIQHGPLALAREGLKLALFNADSTIAFTNFDELFGDDASDDPQAQELVSYLKGDFFQGSMTGHLLGGYSFDARIQPFAVVDDANQFDFKGLHVFGSGVYTSKAWQGQMTFLGLEVKSADSNFTIESSPGYFDLVSHSASIISGEGRIDFPKITINSVQGSATMTGASIAFEQRYENNQVSLTEVFDLGQIESPLPLTGAKYTLELNNLQAEAIELWSDWAAQLSSASEQELEAAFEDDFRTLLDGVLKQGLQFNQQLELDVLGGRFDASLATEYLEFEDQSHILDVENPIDYLSALKLDLAISSDESVVMQLPVAAMLPGLEQQGLIVRDNGKLTLNAAMLRGDTQVNGQPYPLKEQLQMLLPPPQKAPEPEAEAAARSQALDNPA